MEMQPVEETAYEDTQDKWKVLEKTILKHHRKILK